LCGCSGATAIQYLLALVVFSQSIIEKFENQARELAQKKSVIIANVTKMQRIIQELHLLEQNLMLTTEETLHKGRMQDERKEAMEFELTSQCWKLTL
jgi:hypothetical protein